MALSLDTHASSHAIAAQATVSSKAVSITTNQTNNIICVWANAYNSGTGIGANTFSVSDTAGLTWTRRGTLRLTGAFGQLTELWWALAASTLSADSITATYSGGSITQVSIAAFAVNGADTTTPFDTNVSLPATSVTGSGGARSVSISTTSANDMLISFEGNSNGTQSVPTGGPGSFTKIDGNAAVTIGVVDSQQIVSATLSSSTINAGNAGTAASLFVDAIQQAGGGGGGTIILPPWLFETMAR